VTQLVNETPALNDARGKPAVEGRFRANYLPRVLSIGGFLIAWQLIVPYLRTRLIATPIETVQFMIQELRGITAVKHTVYESFGITLTRLGIGLLITLGLGVIIGVGMGLSKRTNALFHDFVIGALSMPYVIWALIAAMWFGFGFLTTIVVVVIATIPFMITNVAEGVAAVPRELVDMARAFDVSRPRIVRMIVVPAVMPFIFSGFRYALSLGWKALIVAEVFGSDRGAGWVIRFWYTNGTIAGLFAYLGFFVLISVAIDSLTVRVSNRVFRWRPEVTGRMTARQVAARQAAI
jgi:NitT/TauT family transport system permease protein